MAITVSAMLIPVHDPDTALGLEVRNDVAAGGFRWVTVGAAEQDVDIVLFPPHGPSQAGSGCAFGDLSGDLVRIAQA